MIGEFSEDKIEIILYFKSKSDKNISKLSHYKTSLQFDDAVNFINKTTPMGGLDDDFDYGSIDLDFDFLTDDSKMKGGLGGVWCDNKIAPMAYIKMLGECDIIMLVAKKGIDIAKSNPSDMLFSFSGLKYDHPPNLYLHIICKNPDIERGVGVGKYTVQEVEKIAAILNAEYVELSALFSAIKFYEKIGYTKVDNNCKDEECIMKKQIKVDEVVESKTKTKTPKRKSKFNRRLKSVRKTIRSLIGSMLRRK